MSFSWREMFLIVLIAFAGIWLIDRGLMRVGGGRYAINSPNGM